MNLNFESLKLNFTKYLKKNTDVYDENKDKINSSDVSVFMYAAEFKNYLKEELNIKAKDISDAMDEISDMEMVDGKLVEKDKKAKGEKEEKDALSLESVQKYADENGVDMEDPELVVNIFNDLLQDDDFRSNLDITQDGEITDDEVKAFFDTIKSYDKNENTISLDDILCAVQDINDGKFKMVTDEENEQETAQEVPKAQDSASLATPLSSGGSVGSSYGSPGSFAPVEKPKYDENGKAIVENMTTAELTEELSKAQGDLTTKQSNLEAIMNGSDPTLVALKEQEETAYGEYQTELKNVDSEMAQELDNAKINVDNCQKALDDHEMQISQLEVSVNDLKTSLDNAKNRAEMMNAQLQALQDKNNDGSLSEKISALESEVNTAQQTAQDAEKKYKEEEAKLTELKNNNEFQENLDEANKNLSDIEDQISKKYPELDKFQKAWEEAKEKYNTQKTELQTAAQKEVSDAQNYVNEISTALSASQTKDDLRQYGAGNQEIIDLAMQYLGYNEADGSANVFLGGASSASTPWCAAFVSYILGQNGIDTGGTWAVSELLNWGQSNGSFIPKSDSNADTVKPGDVVIWQESGRSHTGIVTSISPDGTYTTIEGNTSNRVGERTYNINTDNTLTGFISIDS